MIAKETKPSLQKKEHNILAFYLSDMLKYGLNVQFDVVRVSHTVKSNSYHHRYCMRISLLPGGQQY